MGTGVQNYNLTASRTVSQGVYFVKLKIKDKLREKNQSPRFESVVNHERISRWVQELPQRYDRHECQLKTVPDQ